MSPEGSRLSTFVVDVGADVTKATFYKANQPRPLMSPYFCCVKLYPKLSSYL